MRLIDADSLKAQLIYYANHMQDNGHLTYAAAIGEAISIVDRRQTLDAVPVVRCKDCRNARMPSIKEMSIFEPYCLVCLYPHGAGVSYPEYGMEERIVTQNDYCSYGKQRENV